MTAGEGTALFDARLTPLDSQANQINATGGTARGEGGRVQVTFAAGTFAQERDVRVTSVSPQGLANLLPYGWSPVPGAIVDVRAVEGASGAFASPAQLRVVQVQGLAQSIPLVLARYDETMHGWMVVATGLNAGANGALEADLPAAGQYAFLVADTGANAPPAPVAGQPLTSSRPADSALLDAATATAVATPRTANYTAAARSSINFVATAPSQLPSGVAIEATFGETYKLLAGRDSVLVDRPAQDFVLYSYPAASVEQPNRLAAFFVAKPTRTDYTIAELLNANVHVEIRSGRQTKTGVLVGAGGGTLRASNGAQLTIPANALQGAQPIFFNDVQTEFAGAQLPGGYEIVAAFDVDLTNTTLNRAGSISMPAVAGDMSRIVVARLLTVGGQRAPKLVARAVEENGRLVSSVAAPAVPPGVALSGITSSGRYVFIRVPQAFGYLKGTVTEGGPAASVRVSADQTPFVDVTGADGKFVLVGAAGADATGTNQIGAASLTSDATGRATSLLGAQDAVADSQISLATQPLAVESVSPANSAQNMIVTTPVTVTFNKPVSATSLTGSTFTLTTASGNPVIGQITVLAGNRVAVITPATTLAGSTSFKVTVTSAVRDIYGKPLANPFVATFTTAGVVKVDDRLKPEKIKINYPDADGICRILIPAGAVPEGSTIVAINNASGSTASTVAGTTGVQLNIQAQVGDEITLIIRQPDGVEYRVSQGAYRRSDGFTSVGSAGGALTSDDGEIVLDIPAGAVSGQADIKLAPRAESEITTPRVGDMAPEGVAFGGGVTIRAEGNFQLKEELHLELPATGNVTEGQRVAFMRPNRITTETGEQQNVWEPVTSGKVEDGKFKTTSPPFIGLWFDPGIWEFYVFIPRFMRAVHGTVTERVPGGAPKPIGGARVTITQRLGQVISISTTSDARGGFCTFEFYFSTSDPVEVRATVGGRTQVAIASPFYNTDPFLFVGLAGLSSMYANVIFPPESDSGPERKPALLQVIGKRADIEPGQPDSLVDSGFVPVGKPVTVAVQTFPAVSAQGFKGRLLVGGTEGPRLTWEQKEGAGAAPGTGSSLFVTTFQVLAEGNYTVDIETFTTPNVAPSKATAEYSFISLTNPNNKPPLEGAPKVISVTPANNATQIEVGSKIHLEFSEPVKNLVAGTTVFVRDEAAGTQIGGKITSGGIAVGADESNISVIDFEPSPALEGGKTYTVNVTSGVVDTESDPLQPAFKSTFKTFTGVVLTPNNPMPDAAYRVASAGQYAATVFNDNIGGSLLTVYDMSNPQVPTIAHKGFISQRAIAIAMAENQDDTFKGGAERDGYSRIAIITTHALPDISRAMNLWIYNLDDPSTPEVIGVVSLSFPNRTTSVPGYVTIHGKRAYVGTMSQGGLVVVDIEQAISQWAAAVRFSPNFSLQHPKVKAVQPDKGFGMESKLQSIPINIGPQNNGNPSPITSVSVIDQVVQSEPFGNDPLRMPVAYVATPLKPELYVLGTHEQKDGQNGWAGSDGGGYDFRVLGHKPVAPVGNVLEVRAVSGITFREPATGQTPSHTRTGDLAVALGATRLWFFDVSTPTAIAQLPSHAFSDLGINAGYAKRMEVEGTIAYIIFTDKIVAIDFKDPRHPVHLATVSNVGDDLRWVSVHDGFIYSLSNGTGGRNGLNVSIASAVSQVLTYGVNASEPDKVCANPVVIDRQTKVMAQPAGIYFQIFGRDLPRTTQVVIAREKMINQSVTRETITTIPATVQQAENPGEAGSSQSVMIGHAQWTTTTPIDRSWQYTAEVVLDGQARTEFRARREPIAFSFLISEAQSSFYAPKGQTGFYSYMLGNSASVKLTVNGENVFGNPDPQKPNQPQDPTDPHTRSYGLNVDPVFHNLPEGKYTFLLKATLEGNPNVTDELEGEMDVTGTAPDMRSPGNVVVNNVELSNGNLALTYADAEIKNRGLSLAVLRSYNKDRANHFNPFGYGWNHNYQMLLTHNDRDTDKSWALVGGDGTGQKFLESKLNNGEVPAEDPHQGKLVKNADGSFDYYTKAYVKHHFPGALEIASSGFYNSSYMGNLSYIEEPNGNRITLTYDAEGRMTRATDSSNRSLNYTYELAETPLVGVMSPSSNNVISCTNKSQFNIVRKRFLKAQIGKAWRIKEINGPGGLKLEYEYDADGNLERATRVGQDSASVTTGDSVWKYEYNPTAPEGSGVPTVHLLKSVTNPNDSGDGKHKTSYDYQFEQRRSFVKSINMPEGVTNTFTNTLEGSNITQTVVKDGNQNSTTYKFDRPNRTTTVTGPRGDTTVLVFNLKGQQESITDAEGMKTSIGYDLNYPASTTITGRGDSTGTLTRYNAKFGKLEHFEDGNGHVTEYTLDGKGNVQLITLPTGGQIVFDYHSNGDILSIVDEHNLTTSFTYDAYGNPTVVTRETRPGGETVVTRNTYDVRSRLKTTTDTLAPSVSNTYDALDHLSQVDTSDPTGIRASNTASYTHAPGGQVLTLTMAGGEQTQSTVFAYDDLDRLLRKTETISGTGGFTLNYSYDDNSNLTSESDRRGVTKTYAYDALNFWTKTTVSGPFGASVVVAEATGVDKVGNPQGVTDQYGQTVGLTYDGLHRLRVKTLPGGYTETSDYDANGNIVSTKDRNNRETTMTYDALNRVATEKDPAGRVSTWTYDDASRKTTVEMSPQGLTRSVQLDGMERPLREEVKLGNATYVTSYSYTGRNVEMTDPRGTVSLKTLSAFGDAGDLSVMGTSPGWSNELRYTAFGGLKSRKDANGRSTIYTVDGLNRATAVSHPGSVSESFTYDGEGNVLSHRDRRGTLTEMTYDNLARPLTTKVHDTSGVVPVSTITYNDGSHSESITDARQHTTIKVYDALHRLKSITNADNKTKSFKFDGMNLREETDFRQATTSYTYDEVDRVKEIKDRGGKITTINYTDSGGTRREVTDRRGNQRIEMFDPLGRIVNVTDGGQLLYSVEYDGNNNRKLLVDGRQNRINYDYDPLDRLETVNHSSVQTETYAYDGVGNVLSYSNGFGNPVTQTFDQLDHLATRTDGESNTTTYKYDGEGLLLRKTDPKGGRYATNYEYNAFGSLTKVTDAAQGIWQYEYYPDQTVKSVKDPLGHTVEYDYDALKRLTSVTQQASASLVTAYGYDANGNRTSIVDPKNQRTNIEYDALDRAKSIQYASATGAGPRQQNLEYDPEGNLTALNETTHNGLDIVSRSYARTYDARNRLASATDPYNRRVSYGYDAANNLTSVRDASERETGYDYDSLNRVSTARLPGGASVGYTWKPNGLLESVRYASGMERNYSYDNASRLRSVVNTIGQNQSEEYAYTYDGNSNRTKETRKFGGSAFRTVNYNYDDLDRLSEAAYSDENARGLRGEYYANADFTELKLERLDANVDFTWADGASPAPGLGADNFSVRWTGQVKALHSQGYTFSIVSDEGVRLWVNDQLVIDHWTSHTTTEDSGVIALDAGQKYDIRLEFREGTGNAEVRLMWQSASQEKQVIPRSQLTPPTPKLKYEYDAAGNRKRESGRDSNDRPVNYSFDYDAANRMTDARGYAGGDIAYDYDNNGNLVSAQQGGQTARYEYDARDQLRRVVNFSQQEVARYDYDFERRRLSKTVAGAESRFVYSGDNLIGEYGAGGLQNNRYDYGHDLVRSDLRGEGERWHFSDALGSVTALSGVENGVAAVAARYEYGAWGNLMGGGGSLNQFGYTGQRADAETGLMPLGNGERYYSSTLGRFIQQDSYIGMMNAPATLNRFAYGNNNPIVHTDPSGHIAFLALIPIALLIGGAINKGMTFYANYNYAEARRMEAGLSEDEAASSWWLAAKDTSGYTGLKRAWTGRDPYTGRHLSGKERAWEGFFGALDAIDTITMVVGAVRAASTGIRAGVGALRGAQEVAGGARTAVTALERSTQAVRALESSRGLVMPGVTSAARFGRTAALAERVSESWRGARSVLRSAKDEIANVAQDFRLGWRARPRATYLGAGFGSLQEVIEHGGDAMRGVLRGRTARQVAGELEEAASRGLRPVDFGLETIADNPQLHRMWEDSLKAVSQPGFNNAYTRYLQKLEAGEALTQLELVNAFNYVRSKFLDQAKAAGHQIAALHHWNFGKTRFPNQLVDPRNLVPVPEGAIHRLIHRLTSSGTNYTKDPIAPIHQMLIDTSVYPLAPR
ncbi:MAG TPA: Ig-like domain-containing protein [Pyrinomonadaceae bacterium]|nr:Ig-like domain-containing protein [Pyrinomonadaceae bacterium]